MKFNERSFVQLLGDMRSYNFVVVITPDFEGSQIRIRAMDFDQQAHNGRKSFYLPQFFKENATVVKFCQRLLNPQSAYQYQREEQALMRDGHRITLFTPPVLGGYRVGLPMIIGGSAIGFYLASRAAVAPYQWLYSLAGILLVAALPLAAQAQGKEPVKVGLVSSKSGVFAEQGEEVIRAVRFAVEEANARGGVDGGENNPAMREIMPIYMNLVRIFRRGDSPAAIRAAASSRATSALSLLRTASRSA